MSSTAPGPCQDNDANIKLMDYNARWYSSLTGRFISPDTIVPDPANPQSLNRYAYVVNNPVKYRDPSGHDYCVDEDCKTVDNPATGEIRRDDRSKPMPRQKHEYFAMEGLAHLLKAIDLVKQNLNPDLQVDGVLLTMHDPRTNLSQQVVDEVRQHFPGRVFESIIPRNVRLSEAPSHGRPITHYDARCSGAKSYVALTQEVMRL